MPDFKSTFKFGLRLTPSGEIEPCKPEEVVWDDPRRIVGRAHFSDGSVISTAFICYDTTLGDSPRPVCFETAVLGLPNGESDVLSRYSSWADAEVGHRNFRAARIIDENVTVVRDETAYVPSVWERLTAEED